jgi:predicted TPR repeat methyltransferase
MATDFERLKDEYNNNASTYSDYTPLPIGVLETQLFNSALGDCAGLSVLDLGGGKGLKARQALDAGAAFVELIDISADM